MKVEFTNFRWFETISSLVLIVGLGLVWYELHQTKIIASTDGAVAAVEGEVGSRSLLLEHANVWRRGCADEPLDEDEALIFTHLVQVSIFPLFTRWLRHEAGMTSARHGTFTGIIARNVKYYPGYRKAWEVRSLRYPPKFKSEVDTLVAEGNLLPGEHCGL